MPFPLLIYCYDAYCSWCYGFSPVMRSLAAHYAPQIPVEVLSGGMIINEQPIPIRATAAYIREFYPVVEQRTGVRFGTDYLWHIEHPELSDWFPDSEMPAIALCILKEYMPHRQAEIAADFQYALHGEGRDLGDKEAYRHLLDEYHVSQEEFYDKLGRESYKEKAHYEFALCRQLQVSGFPTLFLQVSESRFYVVARGFTEEALVRKAIDSILEEESLAPKNE